MEQQSPNTDTLLGEYADRINKYGADSDEAEFFLRQHKHNTEFFKLAIIARNLRKILDRTILNQLNKRR